MTVLILILLLFVLGGKEVIIQQGLNPHFLVRTAIVIWSWVLNVSGSKELYPQTDRWCLVLRDWPEGVALQNEMGASEKRAGVYGPVKWGIPMTCFFLGLNRIALERAGMSIFFLSKVIITGNMAESKKEKDLDKIQRSKRCSHPDHQSCIIWRRKDNALWVHLPWTQSCKVTVERAQKTNQCFWSLSVWGVGKMWLKTWHQFILRQKSERLWIVRWAACEWMNKIPWKSGASSCSQVCLNNRWFA